MQTRLKQKKIRLFKIEFCLFAAANRFDEKKFVIEMKSDPREVDGQQKLQILCNAAPNRRN